MLFSFCDSLVEVRATKQNEHLQTGCMHRNRATVTLGFNPPDRC